jgi:hypothetical protein
MTHLMYCAANTTEFPFMWIVSLFFSFIGNFNLVDWKRKKLEKHLLYHHFNFYEKDQD